MRIEKETASTDQKKLFKKKMSEIKQKRWKKRSKYKNKYRIFLN